MRVVAALAPADAGLARAMLRWPRRGRLVTGLPMVVVADGKPLEDTMGPARVTRDDMQKTHGGISVIPKDAAGGGGTGPEPVGNGLARGRFTGGQGAGPGPPAATRRPLMSHSPIPRLGAMAACAALLLAGLPAWHAAAAGDSPAALGAQPGPPGSPRRRRSPSAAATPRRTPRRRATWRGATPSPALPPTRRLRMPERPGAPRGEAPAGR